jgi:hypothetical protein
MESVLRRRESPSTLLKFEVHFLVHNTPPLDPSTSQINTIHTAPYYLTNIHFNIILPAYVFFVFHFLQDFLATPSMYSSSVSSAFHARHIFLYLKILDNIWRGLQVKKLPFV